MLSRILMQGKQVRSGTGCDRTLSVGCLSREGFEADFHNDAHYGGSFREPFCCLFLLSLGLFHCQINPCWTEFSTQVYALTQANSGIVLCKPLSAFVAAGPLIHNGLQLSRMRNV